MGSSAAETPTPPSPQRPEEEFRAADDPVPNALRASDAEREQVAAKLRDEFVAGRLSHETFLHRMDAVLGARRQADLPPLVADLPPRPAPPRPVRQSCQAALAAWWRGAWDRLYRLSGRVRGARGARGRTTGLPAAPDAAQPAALKFPRGTGYQFIIGRAADCDLTIADMTVSRRHASLERTTDGWLLSDLESTNGTRVNGWRVRGKFEVRAGDLVSFGNTEAVFED